MTHAAVHRTILITGACGQIGRYFAEHVHDRYDLRLLDKSNKLLEEPCFAEYGQPIHCDLMNYDEILRACTGIDTVIHLAAETSPSAAWAELLPANILSTYNVFAAAKAAGCRRIIYASSIHAVSGYPPDVQVKPWEAVNPGDLYGVTKCFGEALGRYMAEKEGLSCIVIRIGALQPDDVARSIDGLTMLDVWISQRDLQQLLERSIEVEGISFILAHGISDNRFKRLDLSTTMHLLNYQPQDDLTAVNATIQHLQLTKRVYHHNVDDDRQQSPFSQTDIHPLNS